MDKQTIIRWLPNRTFPIISPLSAPPSRPPRRPPRSPAMMLVHKQPSSHFPPSPFMHHRRHPSAPPAVVVQPTRTPGLLSLSKPARPSPQRQQQPQHRHPRSTPRPKPPQAHNSPSPQLSHAAPAPLLTPSVEILEKKPLSEKVRGRQQIKPKEKAVQRSASQSPVNRRSHPRQPSPPQQQQSSQAEGPTTPTPQVASSNLFDPFLDDAPRTTRDQTPPTLSTRPTGKLARRRQPIPAFHQSPTPAPAHVSVTPTPSQAIPVPHPKPKRSQTLSRSEPLVSQIRPPPKRASTSMDAKWDAFPICDDMTDAGDLSDAEPPATPTRTHRYRFDNGPRTAPLSGFPFNTATPPPASKGRNHRRTPSEGMFHMSSDEDSTPLTTPSNVQVLLGLGASRRNIPASVPRVSSSVPKSTVSATVPRIRESREKQLEREAAAVAAGYFASSMFQNSPSPEELPPPSFV